MKTFSITLFPWPIPYLFHYSLISHLFHRKFEVTSSGCFWFFMFHCFFYPLQADVCLHHSAEISEFSNQQLFTIIVLFELLQLLRAFITPSSLKLCPRVSALNTRPCPFCLTLTLASPMLVFFSWTVSLLTAPGVGWFKAQLCDLGEVIQPFWPSDSSSIRWWLVLSVQQGVCMD